jgi:hypothetical protein
MSIFNNLTSKSGEGPLLIYCKIGAKSKGYNWLGPLVRKKLLSRKRNVTGL